MKSPRHKRITLSLYLMMRATWPWGFTEILASMSMKLVNRLVFMLLLLRSFRLYGKSVDSSMTFVEVMDKMQPILWAMVAVMVLPTLVELARTTSEKKRIRRSTPEVIKRYCYIMFGSSRIDEKNWNRAYGAQMRILEHALFICLVAPLFLYYSPAVFMAFFVVTNIYVLVATYVPERASGRITGRITKMIANDFYVNFMKNVFFCIYLLICAVIIWLTPGRFPIEFLFLLIVGMRMQMGRAANLVDALRSGALKPLEKEISA